MDENQKQIVEQVFGIAMAATDMSCMLVYSMMQLKKLEPGEALKLIGDFRNHYQDFAKRNHHLPGSAAVYSQIADRLNDHYQKLAKEISETTGSKH